jgi:hypothetical protein
LLAERSGAAFDQRGAVKKKNPAEILAGFQDQGATGISADAI